MGMVTGGQLVARMPGGRVRHAFTSPAPRRAIYAGSVEEGIEVIDTRHEQGAAHAADAYARITRGVGVAVVTAGLA
jgi:acetolactate synthase-1/2/3 large subunit